LLGDSHSSPTIECYNIFYLAGQDVKEFPVKKPLDIVDTNGAGDSFVGCKR
jgi:sugar/nucleoside kinase (ribokinase family)